MGEEQKGTVEWGNMGLEEELMFEGNWETTRGFIKREGH
jgi:hypothetical protein